MRNGEKRFTVFSFDLEWSPARRHRRAVSSYSPDRGLYLCAAGRELDIPSVLAKNAAGRTVVLLDIPLWGSEDLGPERPFRELDRLLARLGMPVLPSYKAGDRGLELSRLIGSTRPEAEVVESYPYAVVRFLWAVREEPEVVRGPRKAVIDLRRWWRDWPPRYKREAHPGLRRQYMSRVLGNMVDFFDQDGLDPDGLLTDLEPRETMERAELDGLCDIYDSLLGLYAGIMLLRGSGWLLRAEAPGGKAMVPILADENLQARWTKLIECHGTPSKGPGLLDPRSGGE